MDNLGDDKYMKKIDLHIHTSPANYEKQFDFSLEKLREYVEFNKLDIIAITNHSKFKISTT